MRFHNVSSLLVIGLFLFDSFVVLLRPMTLILRVLINVSLGHFLIIIIHLSAFDFYEKLPSIIFLNLFQYKILLN